MQLGWVEGILPTSRFDGAVLYGHPTERGSLRPREQTHWNKRYRGRVASCGAQALHVTLVLLPRIIIGVMLRQSLGLLRRKDIVRARESRHASAINRGCQNSPPVFSRNIP